MRSKLAHERREVGEKTKETMRTAVIEEQRLNELTRGRQHSRVSQCRGTTRCAGGCRRKIHRQQHMVKLVSTAVVPSLPSLIISAAVPMACAVLMSSVGSTATIAAVSAGATMAQQSWNSHWLGIYACSRVRAKYVAAYMHIDTITANGITNEKYLVDLGAAASVIPLSAFAKTCLKYNLAPSEASLRGASGHGI